MFWNKRPSTASAPGVVSGRVPTDPPAATWLPLLDSPFGRERQRAVRRLGALRHGPALAGLLLRANDWVPQVRAEAVTAVRGLLSDEQLPHWRDALPALLALVRGRRADHGALLADIAAFLGTPARVAALLGEEAPVAPDARVDAATTRWCFDLGWRAAGLMSDPDAARARLLLSAIDRRDAALSRFALDTAPALPAPWRDEVLTRLCRCSFAPLRAAALRALGATATAETLTRAEAMCLDRNADVRRVALGLVQAHGDAGRVADAARRALADPTVAAIRAVAALDVLSLLDPTRGPALWQAHAGSRRTELRRAALSRLIGASVDPQREDWVRRALDDRSARVQRVAVDAIRRGAMPPAPVELLGWTLHRAELGALRRALAISRHWSAWTRLDWLLTLSEQALPAGGAEACVLALDQWLGATRGGITPPSKTDADRLLARWHRVAPRLPARLATMIGFQLRAA